MKIGDKIKTKMINDFWFSGIYSDDFADTEAVVIDNGKMSLIVPKKNCELVTTK